jgi:hypothetical protein
MGSCEWWSCEEKINQFENEKLGIVELCSCEGEKITSEIKNPQS